MNKPLDDVDIHFLENQALLKELFPEYYPSPVDEEIQDKEKQAVTIE